MKNKNISFLILIVILFTFFAGCSTNKTTPTSNTATNSNVSKNDNSSTQKTNSVESNSKDTEQKFSKSDTDILNDLKSSNDGIQAVDSITITLTYGKNDTLGYTPIQKVNKFRIANVGSLTQTTGIVDDVKLWKEVTVETDVDFEINDQNNMYERNGKYNGKGTFILLYHLVKNNDNKLTWTYSSVKSLSPKFKIVKTN